MQRRGKRQLERAVIGKVLGRPEGWVSTEVNEGNGGDTHSLRDQS